MKEIFFSFFLEGIKLGFWIGVRSVIRTLFLLTLATDVRQVIREGYQLGDIVEATELTIFKTVSGSVLLRLDSSLSISDSIWLFDFDIRKRQAIDKNNNIWTEFILTILASNFKG